MALKFGIYYLTHSIIKYKVNSTLQSKGPKALGSLSLLTLGGICMAEIVPYKQQQLALKPLDLTDSARLALISYDNATNEICIRD